MALISKGFKTEWKKKVRQLQVPIFALNTKAAWALRFDDILADALELSALRTNVINELWHGNIIPQEDSRNNSKEMKELLGYMARHHEDLEKTFTDEQKEIFEKFHDCWDEYVSLAEAAIFEYAFRLGARLTMEIHKDEK